MAAVNKTEEVVEHEHVPDSPPNEEKVTVEVDTVHGDEAMRVIAAYDGPLEWEPMEEKKLRRKLDNACCPFSVLPSLSNTMTKVCIIHPNLHLDSFYFIDATTGMLSIAVSRPFAIPKSTL